MKWRGFIFKKRFNLRPNSKKTKQPTNMKTIKFLAPVIAAFILFSCKPSPEKARMYNDQIIDQQVKIQEKENDLIDKVSEGNPDAVSTAIDAFLSQVRISTAVVAAMPSFDKKDDYK